MGPIKGSMAIAAPPAPGGPSPPPVLKAAATSLSPPPPPGGSPNIGALGLGLPLGLLAAPLGLARPPGLALDLARLLDLAQDPLGLAHCLGLSDDGGCWAARLVAHCPLAAHPAVGLRGCGRTRRQPFVSLRCLTQR